jgi:hypothetical protein
MTEAEWLATKNPILLVRLAERLLRNAGRIASGRKFLLLGCACCRSVSPPITEACCLRAIEVAEMAADGGATRADYEAVAHLMGDASILAGGPIFHPTTAVCALIHDREDRVESGIQALVICAEVEAPVASLRFWKWPHQWKRYKFYVGLIRDIFGNPFRSVTPAPHWCTSDAVAMARGMYESRDFSAMPILADALQDAGCDNPDVLDHCRGPNGKHVRGCWVVDLILGRD